MIYEILAALAAWLSIFLTILLTYGKTKERQATLQGKVENMESTLHDHETRIRAFDEKREGIDKRIGEIEAASKSLERSTDNLEGFLDHLRAIKPMCDQVERISETIGEMIENHHKLEIKVTKLEK